MESNLLVKWQATLYNTNDPGLCNMPTREQKNRIFNKLQKWENTNIYSFPQALINISQQRKIDCNDLPSLLKRNILVFALIRNIKFHYKLYSIISDELFNIFKTRISLLANCSWNIAKVTIKQTGIVHVRLVKTGKGWDGLWTKNLMIFLIFGEFDNSWEMKGYMYLNKN